MELINAHDHIPDLIWSSVTIFSKGVGLIFTGQEATVPCIFSVLVISSRASLLSRACKVEQTLVNHEDRCATAGAGSRCERGHVPPQPAVRANRAPIDAIGSCLLLSAVRRGSIAYARFIYHSVYLQGVKQSSGRGQKGQKQC